MRSTDTAKELAKLSSAISINGQIEYLPPRELTPYAGNARTHDARQIEIIKASLSNFGFVNPALIDKHNNIVAGHGRIIAAIELGYEQVPTLRIEGLTPDQIRAYRLADNRIAEKAGWDPEILSIELQHLTEVEVDFSVEVTGWNMAEIDTIILDRNGKNQAEEEDAAEAIPEVLKLAVSREGDLWTCNGFAPVTDLIKPPWLRMRAG